MSPPLVVLALASLVLVPATGHAQPLVDVQGVAIARNVRAHVSGERRGDGWARAHVVVELEIVAVADVVLRSTFGARLPTGARVVTAHLLAAGMPLRREARAVRAGEAIAVHADVVLDLDTSRGWESLMTHPGIGVRHPLLGESWLNHHSALDYLLSVVEGPALRVEPAAFDVDTEAPLQVHGDPDRAEIRLQVRPPHGGPPEGPVANGGPVITVGGSVQQGVATLGVGYEVGLFEHLIVSAWLETDFASLGQALLVEAVTPGAAFFLVPSFGAGVGLIARELGPGDPQLGVRLRLEACTYALGFVADFDYLPATDRWSVTLAGRVGL